MNESEKVLKASQVVVEVAMEVKVVQEEEVVVVVVEEEEKVLPVAWKANTFLSILNPDMNKCVGVCTGPIDGEQKLQEAWKVISLHTSMKNEKRRVNGVAASVP